MKLRILSSANRELAAAAQFYLKEGGARIADRFLNEVKSASANIAADPNRNAIHRNDIRVYRLPSFPYSIYYRIKPTEIVAIAISHNSRRSDYWRNRL